MRIAGEIDSDSLVSPNYALVARSPNSVDFVLANPPFGKKSSMTFTNEEGEQERNDLTYITITAPTFTIRLKRSRYD